MLVYGRPDKHALGGTLDNEVLMRDIVVLVLELSIEVVKLLNTIFSK